MAGISHVFSLLDPMDCSTPAFPVYHQLPVLTQTHLYRVGNAIQLSHLSSPSLPAFNLSQHQDLFPKRQFFTSGGQSIGVSAWASILPISTQDWFPLGWTGWISLQSKGLSRNFSNKNLLQQESPAPQLNSIDSSVLSFLIVQLSHPYMTTGKTKALTRWTFVGKVMSLLFNLLS